MLIDNYIFTITTGRSGQASLYDILQRYSIGCISEFESPNINTNFSGIIGEFEKRFRRKFIETNELLGRGKVLKSFEDGKEDYIEYIAKKRLNKIYKDAKKINANIYFDVSKFYARGLYVGFNNILDNFSVVLLLRDPLLNMKSFLNRNKNFYLDNLSPSSSSNVLIIPEKNLETGELYLWAWTEMYLRFKIIKSSEKVKQAVIIRTTDLQNVKKMEKYFSKLRIPHNKIKKIYKINTNDSQGYGNTRIDKNDLRTLEKFISRMPSSISLVLDELEKSLIFHSGNG